MVTSYRAELQNFGFGVTMSVHLVSYLGISAYRPKEEQVLQRTMKFFVEELQRWRYVF